ncbi:hypothetical protein [Aeromicrobium sp.]|uniref:hypothetical protein n=1 Tax=Aeromicrobium sp. TaxID=1871063 RepID=UPI002FC5BFF9
MPLDSLAAPADLPSAWSGHADAQDALDVASAAIREAAGNLIAPSQTVTVSVTGAQLRLLALPRPVATITAVTIDGSAVTDYKALPEGLWRACGWGCVPTVVEVSATFGLPEVPADITDLCVQLAVAWLLHRATGGGSTAGLKSVKLDDAAESYTDEAAGQVSPVFIPDSTRRWLAARFGGGGVTVVETV